MCGNLSSHFSSLLFWLLASLLDYEAGANPIEASNRTLVERAKKPTFPSIEEIRQHIVTGKPETNKSLFWAGSTVGGEEAIEQVLALQEYEKRYSLTHIYAPGIWTQPEFVNPNQYQPSPRRKSVFQRNLLRVWAERTKGTVYLLMSYSKAFDERSVFWSMEWPILRDKGQVSEIVWIDSDLLRSPRQLPPDPTTVTRIWWKKGQANPATVPGQKPPGAQRNATGLPTKPRFPTIQECAAALKPDQPPVDKALYYSGIFPDDPQKLETAQAHLASFFAYFDLVPYLAQNIWDPPDFTHEGRYQGTMHEALMFRANFMTVFAKRTQGTVYLFLPYDKPFSGDTFFWVFDWPVLRDNGLVYKIVWLDSNWLLKDRVPVPSQVTRVWWKRGWERPLTLPGEHPPPP